MPEPGSKAYDDQRKELRKEFEDQGLPDQKANERANEVLQGDIPQNERDVKHDRSPGGGRTGHGHG